MITCQMCAMKDGTVLKAHLQTWHVQVIIIYYIIITIMSNEHSLLFADVFHVRAISQWRMYLCWLYCYLISSPMCMLARLMISPRSIDSALLPE